MLETLASYRGPVGVEIAVQGRGFTKYDSIILGGKESKTRYLSENELRFTIPALPAGVDYPVQLIGGPHGALDIGNFRIDESQLGVVPTSLEFNPETRPRFFSKSIMRLLPEDSP